MIKYSFLIPYHHRPDQFNKTLQSYLKFYEGRDDYELIIIEDAKHTEEQTEILENLLWQYKSKLFFQRIRCQVREIYNPAPAYNEGAYVARGKFFVITNPECRHACDILAGFDAAFAENEDQYLVCACKALSQDGSFHRWYQHSVECNRSLHFCAALLRESYFERVHGFNEVYSDGYGYDDDSFLLRVQNAGIHVVNRDDLLVEHLWHQKIRPPDYQVRLAFSKRLFEREKRQVFSRGVK